MNLSDNVSIISCPNIIHFGVGSLSMIKTEIALLHGTKALIVSDPGIVKAGLTKRVENILDEVGLQYTTFSNVEPEPSIATVDNCIKFAKERNVNIVIAIGGGSALDVGKSTAICLGDNANVRDLRDYIGLEKITKRGLPKILIPTTSGSGSEVSRGIVLTDQIDHTKKAIKSRFALADVVIVDPSLMLSLPKHVTAETGTDALSHAIEAYVSPSSNTYTDVIALKAIRLIASNMKKVYANGSNLEARVNMAKASMMAGIAFGSTGLGCIHALAYPFTTMFSHSHGKAQGMAMPGVLKYNFIANEQKFIEIAKALGANIKNLTSREAALKAAEEVEILLNDVGIKTKLREYNIRPEQFPLMAEQAINANMRLVNNNPRTMSVEDAIEIYKGQL